MRKINYIWLLLMVGITFNANASSYIVDTGEPTSGGGFVLNPDQSLAGQFTLTNSYTIDSLEGWFDGREDGTATAAVYTDSATFPGNELFSAQFTLDITTGNNLAWDGAYGLNWALDPGIYWLVFEVRPGDSLPSAAMPYQGIPNPLDKYAYFNTANGAWVVPGPIVEGFGMRVSAVPVPAAVWLFGSGLIGLMAIARRKKA